MSFFAEVKSAIGLDETRLLNGYQVINYGGEAVYVEGFKRVSSIDKSEICLELKTGRLMVIGSDLHVFLLEGTSLIIKGSIQKIEEEK